MRRTRFQMTMLNSLQIGPHERRHEEPTPVINEWLLVERTKYNGGVLCIADTMPSTGIPDNSAPDDLVPKYTIVAFPDKVANATTDHSYVMKGLVPFSVIIPHSLRQGTYKLASEISVKKPMPVKDPQTRPTN